jgi:hypothetical protein
VKKQEVLQHLEPLMGVTMRTIEHQPTTKVAVQPDQVILRPGAGGRLIPLNEQGVKSLAQFIGMPQSMGKEISPDLFGQVANYILARRGHYSVMLIDGAIASFGRAAQGRQINPERLVNTIERAIPNPEYLNVNIAANYTASIELVGDKREPVVRGDLIRAGALVNFSPVGTIAPSVQSFVVRLACTNGMTENTVLQEYNGGGGSEGDDAWQWFRKALHDAYGAITPIVNRYREMIKNRIPDKERALILENMIRKAGIKGDLADAIRAQAIQDPPRNEYQMLNLITFASSHLAREHAQVQRLRAVAAEFSSEERHSGYCPICHHAS